MAHLDFPFFYLAQQDEEFAYSYFQLKDDYGNLLCNQQFKNIFLQNYEKMCEQINFENQLHDILGDPNEQPPNFAEPEIEPPFIEYTFAYNYNGREFKILKYSDDIQQENVYNYYRFNENGFEKIIVPDVDDAFFDANGEKNNQIIQALNAHLVNNQAGGSNYRRKKTRRNRKGLRKMTRRSH